MKILVAVISCHSYEDSGLNQPIRETWLPEAVRRGLDYKFFFGQRVPVVPRAPKRNLRRPVDRPDVVVLNVPDDYGHIAVKTREAHRWAYDNGYDFVFQCFPDTYACVERLLSCGFEKCDYFGNFDPGFFCCGGQGHWLSRKACSYIINEDVDWRVGPWHTNWCETNQGAEDVWIGMMLKKHEDIVRGHSDGFVFKGRIVPGPTKRDKVITSHLSDPDESAHGGYRGEYMYEKHQQWLAS